MKERRLSLSAALTLLAPIALIHYLSTMPTFSFSGEDESALVVSFKKVTRREHMCNEEELAAFRKKAEHRLKHMRRANAECGSRERAPLEVNVWVDGMAMISRDIQPNGINRDMPVYVHEKLKVAAGAHTIKVAIRDSRESPDKFDYIFDTAIKIEPRGVVVISFKEEEGGFAIL